MPILHDCPWCSGNPGYVRFTYQGERLCENCWEQYTVICLGCESRTDVDNMQIVMGNQRCQECFRETHFYCVECDNVTPNSENINGGMICNECDEQDADDHDSLDGCDCALCNVGTGVDSINTNTNVRRWGDRPQLRFVDRGGSSHVPAFGQWYMGMEIELESVREVVNAHIEAFPNLWATTDATLGPGGLEIISHPCTFAAWQEGIAIDWDKWKALFHDQLPDQTLYTSNGIHVHISRTAFLNEKGKNKPSHMYKFMQFIYRNQGAIQNLAGREDHSYCHWDASRDAIERLSDVKRERGSGAGRYRPVNTLNDQTLELRFFDGRSDPVFIKRTIQLIHGMVEFTRHSKITDPRDWPAFVAYLEQYDTSYVELLEYINEQDGSLDALAAFSNDAYMTTVIPNIKKQKEAKKRQEQQLLEDTRALRQRRDDLMNNITSCQCTYCVFYEVNGSDPVVT